MRRTMFVTDLAKDVDTLAWLHRNSFPSDPIPDWGAGSWWLMKDNGKPIAFIGIEPVKSWPGSIYLNRVGVLTEYRGQGIQGFLMTKVEKAAKMAGYQRIISTTYENPASANNFIARGYKTYTPTAKWGAAGTIYWLKELNTPFLSGRNKD